jgi:DNA-binding NarL/FixJ family response regulator
VSQPDAVSQARVLVADDDDAVRMVVGDILEEEGFLVVGRAVDGVEALAMARALGPDVIVLDVRMPRMGGLEAARQLRPDDPDVRLVILSAYDDPTLIQEARAVGAAAFLVKGCSLDELIAAIVA